MVIDKVKTAQYYEMLSTEALCDCDYCKLYHSKSEKAYPELADWFLQFGIDIRKPLEAMWLDPDEMGIVTSYPTPIGVEGDFFVLEAYPMYLSRER